MASPLKKLASETVIYGFSTVFSRIINFVFVPVYTRVLSTEGYGAVAEFMAYIAIFQVILPLGLETGCFRFASSEDASRRESVFSNALISVFGIVVLFLAGIIPFAGRISSSLGYPGYGEVVGYVGGILAMDALTSIMFSKLRYYHNALKFTIIKSLKILTETGANILLFFWFPSFAASHPDTFLLNFVSASADFGYVIFAIFISCLVCTLMLLPDFVRQTYTFDSRQMKSLLVYSLPLMVAALPGIVNDFLDRILFRYFDTSSEVWRSSLGVYQAATKLAVIMTLFVQMFRYAAEPFFFQREKDRNSRLLYAKVMDYFTAFCGMVFLGVVFYIDEISLILGRDFRTGVGIVPIMLGAYMLLGMLFNVSMWYKLSGKTGVAIYITLAGLAVTAIVNVIFMPRYSYYASAWGHFASYLVMMLISVMLGRKHYPIPYNWGKIAVVVALMLAFYGLSSVTEGLYAQPSGTVNWLKAAVHLVMLGAYACASWFVLRRMKNSKEYTEYEMQNNK